MNTRLLRSCAAPASWGEEKNTGAKGKEALQAERRVDINVYG